MKKHINDFIKELLKLLKKINQGTMGDSDCDRDSNCIEGSGAIIQETRTVMPFHTIVVKRRCQLLFEKSTRQNLRIEGDDNILPLITTTVTEDGELTIDSRPRYHSASGIKVYAEMEEIKGFTIAGSAGIKSRDHFSSDALTLTLSGSGKMELGTGARTISSTITGSGSISLAGEADSHNVLIAGSGDLTAPGLKAKKYNITITGTGTCQVHVSASLKAVITGSGSVRYQGSPPVVKSAVTGSGTVHPSS